MKSFKEYIKQRFDNEFWKVAENYINIDFCIDDLSLYKLRKLGDVEIDSVNIEHIWCSDMPAMKIKFDVAFSVSLIIHEGDHRYDDYEEKIIWLLSECEGDIENNFDDFIIKDTYLYNGKLRNRTPMDDSLVPIISKEQLENIAKDILTEHYPSVLEQPSFLDPMELLNQLSLSMEQCTITEDGSIFGRCFFEDTVTKIFNVNENKYIDKNVTARTILVDPKASFLYNKGVINSTIVHECVHWILHRKAFALAKLYNHSLSNISCEVTGGISGQNAESINWMEWQANSLTPKLQMPKEMFLKKAKEIEMRLRREYKLFDDLEVIEPLIDELALFFGVSRIAAKIRLVECGYDVARGAFIYIDGKYVLPHKTSKVNILNNDETFSISVRDVAILTFIDQKFSDKIETGLYTYVNSHMVLNLPLYVQTDIYGNQVLTSYARKHMEECCLVFKLSVKSGVSDKYKSDCFLNRDKHSTIDFNIVFHDGFENAPEERQFKKLKEEIDEGNKILLSLNQNYVDSLNTCKKWRGITNLEIAERSGLNHETVGRCLKGEPCTLNTIILICLALHLSYTISSKIIKDSPHSLVLVNETHQWYTFVLQHMYPKTMEEIRSFLNKMGIQPL
ncbi:ImmA/IrrE family metallo-endopeptidase [Carnobacteriaceae bacterium zg-ZUI252]|nr:ImmA/IrrE family metallo-endopeptidase [Carnobacteriaceae bacterium zg-ZUI252]